MLNTEYGKRKCTENITGKVQTVDDIWVKSEQCEIKLASKLDSGQQSIESTEALLSLHDREKTDKAYSQGGEGGLPSSQAPKKKSQQWAVKVSVISYITSAAHSIPSLANHADCYDQGWKCWKMGVIVNHFLPWSPHHHHPLHLHPSSNQLLLKTNGSRAMTECLVHKSPAAGLLVHCFLFPRCPHPMPNLTPPFPAAPLVMCTWVAANNRN